MNQLRTQAEINQDYTQCSINYGDKTFRQKILAHELQQLEQRMAQLLSEKAAEPVEENINELPAKEENDIP